MFFFFNDTATTEIYTLSLHDALPICIDPLCHFTAAGAGEAPSVGRQFVTSVLLTHRCTHECC